MGNIFRTINNIDDLALYNFINSAFEESHDFEKISTKFIMVGVIRQNLADLDVEALAGSYCYETADANCTLDEGNSLSIKYYRDKKIGRENRQEKSPNFDLFVLGFDGDYWDENPNKVKKILDLLSQHTSGFVNREEHASYSEILTQNINNQNALFNRTLQSLNNQIGEINDQRTELLDALNKKQIELQEEIEATRSKQQKEHENALAELEAERGKLELQSHKSERRSIYNTMTTQTQAEIRDAHTPASAKFARLAVFCVMILFSVVSGIFAYSSFQSISELNNIMNANNYKDENGELIVTLYEIAMSTFGFTNQIPFYIKGILSSFAALGALVFAANWMQKYYNEEIESAKQIERFNYDLSRANWIIETVMEVQSEAKGEVPNAWLDNVTKGLFETSQARDDSSENTNALATILSNSSTLKFGPDGAQVEMHKKGINKAME